MVGDRGKKQSMALQVFAKFSSESPKLQRVRSRGQERFKYMFLVKMFFLHTTFKLKKASDIIMAPWSDEGHVTTHVGHDAYQPMPRAKASTRRLCHG